MKFEDYIKRKIVKRTTRDRQLIKSIIKAVESDLKFFEKSEITEESSRKIVSNYYDILRELLEAMANNDNYKIYSHEAFAQYPEEIKKEANIAHKFDRFRKIRNNINYYGARVSVEEAKEYKKEILSILTILKEKYLRGEK